MTSTMHRSSTAAALAREGRPLAVTGTRMAITESFKTDDGVAPKPAKHSRAERQVGRFIPAGRWNLSLAFLLAGAVLFTGLALTLGVANHWPGFQPDWAATTATITFIGLVVGGIGQVVPRGQYYDARSSASTFWGIWAISCTGGSFFVGAVAINFLNPPVPPVEVHDAKIYAAWAVWTCYTAVAAVASALGWLGSWALVPKEAS